MERIRLSEETRTRLVRYREAVGVDTDEEAIRYLLRLAASGDAFGSMSGWGSWGEEDRALTRSDDRVE